jgi:DNA mismatch repair protein MutL
MRTEETEAAHIQHYLTLAALSFPEVAFTFQKDGRLVWQLPAQKSEATTSSRLEALRERLRSLLGEEKLLSVNFSASLDDTTQPEETDIFETAGPSPSTLNPLARRSEAETAQPSTFRVWGFIGSPGVSRATREGQHLFVNRRPVDNRGLNYALLEGYHTALMKGRYPVCCLFLEIDPAAVDVNIHPAKREVKFHREFEIRKLVAQAVQETLLAFHSVESKVPGPKPKVVAQAKHQPAPEISAPALPNFPEKLKPSLATPPQIPPAAQTPLKMGFLPRRSEAETGAPAPTSHPATLEPAVPSSIIHPPSSPETAAPSAISQLPSSGSMPLLSVPLRLIGVIGKLYVVLESDRGLVLLDQHAAHERILFEQMLNRIESGGAAPSQKLLLPETIELPARDANFLREQLAALTRLGVGLSEFGERTFLLDALPPFVKTADARRFVLDLVDELKAAGREVNLARLGEHTIAKTVCRHAVKAHDPLGGAELENLVEDLRRCAMPYTCPHGRPTLIEMNYRELEKKFGRTQ